MYQEPCTVLVCWDYSVFFFLNLLQIAYFKVNGELHLRLQLWHAYIHLLSCDTLNIIWTFEEEWVILSNLEPSNTCKMGTGEIPGMHCERRKDTPMCYN